MLSIHSVTPGSTLVEPARILFAAYCDFLETIESTHCFDFPRYLEEISTLPAPYTSRNGELLLACIDDPYSSHAPAGCIAFRAAAPPGDPHSQSGTCEIKRLFVQPQHRGLGIARTLITGPHPRFRPRLHPRHPRHRHRQHARRLRRLPHF